MSAQSQKKDNSGTVEVLFGGEAGQGVILCGVMLAQTASEDGSVVAQAARYGAAVRGGEATAGVVISNEMIEFPHVEEPSYLIVSSQQTYDKFTARQEKGTLVIYDPFFVKPRKLDGIRQVSIPATEAAIKEFGKATGANVIYLSALASLTGVVSIDALKRVIQTSLSKKFLEPNMKALAIGQKMAADAEEEKG